LGTGIGANVGGIGANVGSGGNTGIGLGASVGGGRRSLRGSPSTTTTAPITA